MTKSNRASFRHVIRALPKFSVTRNQALFEDPQVDQIMTLTTHDL
jgi:hypothetical protein